ncbi:MAG: hypothetical protein ACEPOW_10945 [Bacteroidales bacterium]
MRTKLSKIVLILLLLFPFLSFSQEIIPKEMTSPWFDNQTHHIYGHGITMIYGGTRGGISTYTTDPVTTLAWRSLPEIVKAIESEEDISKEQKEGKIAILKEDSPGGIFYLYITRYSENEATTNNYYVRIADKNDNTLWKGRLPFQSPNLPIENGWWNFIEVPIPAEVEPPFFIHVNPNYGQIDYEFGFKIDEK